MKNTVEKIWTELKAGDILAYQARDDWDGTKYTTINKIKIATVVAIDVWDMAMVVGVVDLCKFDCHGLRRPKEKAPEVEWLAEWSTSHAVVGLWSFVPPISELKRAIREFRLTIVEPDTTGVQQVNAEGGAG